MLELEHLSIGYTEPPLFHDLSFKLPLYSSMGIYGSNGVGKSSLCLALSGLLDEECLLSGTIQYFDKPIRSLDVSKRCENVGIIFQSADVQLFLPTVEDEIIFALENLCLEPKDIRRRLFETLEMFGIEDLRLTKTSCLSGGERQLVAIASVFAMRPLYIIADELLSHISARYKVYVEKAVSAYIQYYGSFIHVSHYEKELTQYEHFIHLDKYIHQESSSCRPKGCPPYA